MAWFRNGKTIFEAHRLAAEHEDPSPEILEFIGQVDYIYSDRYGGLSIEYPNQEEAAGGEPGDWILRDDRGEFYFMKDDVLRATCEEFRGPFG